MTSSDFSSGTSNVEKTVYMNSPPILGVFWLY
jgi:hypothetical protein